MRVDELRAPGHVIADRLDLMGFDETYIIDFLDETFEDLRNSGVHETSLYAQVDENTRKGIELEKTTMPALDAMRWVELVRSSRADLPNDALPSLDNCRWLFHWLLDEEDFPLIVRACLLAFPDSEVILDVRELHKAWWADWRSDPELLPSAMRWSDPVIVLTEGSTDAEFLKASLEILYPHLTDLIRFMDYGQKPDGGAGTCLNTLKAFAAAGIANRVVAVLDNDTAAAEAISGFGKDKLPKHMTFMQYPEIDLAREYPTLGPSTSNVSGAPTTLTDVRRLAASIELYLGTDVLKRGNGSPPPVQLTSFSAKMRRYQGKITAKHHIQKRFRRKYAAARANTSNMAGQDWEGMRSILTAIRKEAAKL